MYEPIRHPSVHRMAPHNSSVTAPERRPSHLGRQLAGHLAALLAVTRELGPAYDDASRQLADRIRELAPDGVALPAMRLPDHSPERLHAHAHDLAARVLVVAAAQQDTTTAMLACARMDAHAQATSAR